MRSILFISILSLALISCKKDKNSNCQEEYSYAFSYNKQIDTTHNSPTTFFAIVNPGSNIVFSYEYSSACALIADAGYMDKLVFEIPAGGTSFEYDQASELENGKCYFLRTCFCGNVSSRLVAGVIKGTRIDNSRWSIQVNVTVPVNNISLSFNKQFTLD